MASGTGKRWATLAGQGVVMMCLVLGLVAFVGNTKSVVLTVDGQASTVQTFGGTVQEVLDKAQVQVSENDQVSPALTSTVEDGAAIAVVTATAVDVTLNGAETVVHTTGSTVGDLVDEMGVAQASEVSAPDETELVTLSATLTISTPKNVSIAVDGETREYRTTMNSVTDLLAEADITLGEEDRLSVPANSSLVTGMGLKVTRVDSDKTETVTEDIDFHSSEKEDAELPDGVRRVTQAGVAGELTKVFSLTVIDGREMDRRLVSEDVTREPVHEVISVGTKEAEPEPEPEPEPEEAPEAEPEDDSAEAAPAPAPAGGAWQALAECESGGNWSINTGNGYYGGLQFSESSWLGAGGGKYAPLPHLAAPAEQIATAEVLKQNGGWGHWPSCSAKLGLG